MIIKLSPKIGENGKAYIRDFSIFEAKILYHRYGSNLIHVCLIIRLIRGSKPLIDSDPGFRVLDQNVMQLFVMDKHMLIAYFF